MCNNFRDDNMWKLKKNFLALLVIRQYLIYRGDYWVREINLQDSKPNLSTHVKIDFNKMVT